MQGLQNENLFYTQGIESSPPPPPPQSKISACVYMQTVETEGPSAKDQELYLSLSILIVTGPEQIHLTIRTGRGRASGFDSCDKQTQALE